ncbi:hypothetical protein [Actinomadura sp. 3N508]|uniref:hypothetical protein n=1 Tax=Actinomadura sp. 3N508 TaxID=3375153 RepID=UPI003791EEF2
MTTNDTTPPVPGAQIGERVLLTSPTGRARHAGVLLPPVRTGEPHRVHTDKGRVLRLNGAWHAAPERPTADRRRDQRRQYCDAGRPIYRWDDLPAAQLATRTMLQKRLRRRPTEGQEPVASYKVYRGYAPLYAVADTTKLPPLPPARQAAWDQARTCARCRSVKATPYAKGVDGRRYCEDCHEPAARDWWTTQRAEGRRAATAWARRVLCYLPNVILLKSATHNSSFEVRAETLDGAVLVAAEVRDPRDPIPDWWTEEMRARTEARYTPITPVVELLRSLEGRRLVTWRGDVEWLLRRVNQYAGVDLALAVTEHDQAGPFYDEWIGQLAHGGRTFRHNHRLDQQMPPGGRATEVAGIRAALHAMATGSPPALALGDGAEGPA